MSYLVNRVYTKRETDKSNWSGRVGHCELSVDTLAKGDDTFKPIFVLDGNILPDVSAEYLMNFALQSLQDAYAGADSLDEATANWSKKYDALIAGTIGTRGPGSGMTDEEAAEIFVAKAALRTSDKTKAEFKAASDSEKDAMAERTVEKNRDNAKFQELVAARVEEMGEERRKAAEKKAALKAANVEFDL